MVKNQLIFATLTSDHPTLEAMQWDVLNVSVFRDRGFVAQLHLPTCELQRPIIGAGGNVIMLNKIVNCIDHLTPALCRRIYMAWFYQCSSNYLKQK
jgi:hypothetical protein